MILTFIALIIVLMLGFFISRFFLNGRVNIKEMLPISLISGLTIMGYSVLVLALIFRNLKYAVFSFLILAGVFCFFSIFYILKRKGFNLRKGFVKINFNWLGAIFLFLFILLYLDLALKTLVFQEGYYKTTIAGYGDIPFHMSQVSYFNNQQPFKLEETIYSGNKLAYPFLINFLSSSFYVLNHNYVLSFHLPAFIFSISGMVLFYFLISRLIKKKLARICAFLIFFAGGGLGFLKIIKDNSFWLKKGLGEMINYILHLPYPIMTFYNAVYPDQNIVWADILAMFLLHQRSSFFGIALGMLCVFLLCLCYEYNDKKAFYFAGIMIGLLPLANMHSFIALFAIIFSFLLVAAIKKQEVLIAGFLKTAVIALISAFPAIYYLFLYQKTVGRGILTLRLGWMTASGSLGAVQYNPAWRVHFLEWLSFLWQNFGLFLPLLIIATLFLVFSKKNLIWALIFACFSIFSVVNLIKFQPWDYDSNKILIYFVLAGSLIIGYFFDKLKFKGASFLMLALTFFIVISGIIDIFSRSSLANPQLFEIFGPKEIITSDWILKNIPSGKKILTADSHMNLLNSLAGRPVFLGYPGWLWTHGINYQEREIAVRNILSGSDLAKNLLKKHQIDFVLIDPRELGNYYKNYNDNFFKKNYPLVFQLDDIKIYKIVN